MKSATRFDPTSMAKVRSTDVHFAYTSTSNHQKEFIIIQKLHNTKQITHAQVTRIRIPIGHGSYAVTLSMHGIHGHGMNHPFEYGNCG
jgi:hypothetical protein